METEIKNNNGEGGKSYRSFWTDKSNTHSFTQVGKIDLFGERFNYDKVNRIKEILMDKQFFPEITGIDVNPDKPGFGYISIHRQNNSRRAHIHWYELVMRILPGYLIPDPHELKNFYLEVLIEGVEPVNLLYTIYKSQKPKK